MGQEPDRIRAEIEQTREEMSETVDALKRASPLLPQRESNCLMSSSKIRLPWSSLVDDSVQDNEQLAHAGDERDLLRLAGRDESAIEGANDGVPSGRDQGAHIEHGADGRAAQIGRASCRERVCELV